MRLRLRLRHPAIVDKSVPPLVWFLAVAMVVLGAAVTAGGLYLNVRRSTTDQRQADTRQAICTILNALPPSSAHTPPKERRAFTTAYRLEQCKPLPTQPHTPYRSPTRAKPPPAAPASARPAPIFSTVVIRPTTIRPTVTRTTSRPAPSRTPSPHPPHPSASPDPVASCLKHLLNLKTCHQ